MMLPAPKIVVVDDNADDVYAIVEGLAALGTTALGVHYSPDLDALPRLAGVRLLFLDLHLSGTGDSEQQIKNTIGILESFLTPDNGPYAIILWSGHILGYFESFRDQVKRRLNSHLLPLQIVPLDKNEFIEPGVGRRHLVNLDGLKTRIQEQIGCCPQLAALLAWEEGVSQAASDTVRQIFWMACRRNSDDAADGINKVLGELAAAAVGRKNAEENIFRGVNEVLVQVVADRLQHRSAGHETDELWRRAVQLGERSVPSEEDGALLNRFIHVEDGSLLDRVEPWERGSIIGLESTKLPDLWGLPSEELLKEFCLATSQPSSMEWIMVQVQPPCDQAQKNRGLLPYVLGLIGVGISKSKRGEISGRKHLWLSPPLSSGNEIIYIVLNLRFVVGLTQHSELLKKPVRMRVRDQLLAEISHELHSYSGRPGVIRFPE